LEVLDKIDYLSADKRKEEQIKFIFNWVYKTLKARFTSGDQESVLSRTSDDAFYDYYFGDLCKSNNATIQQFRRPSVKKRFETESPKTFNASFLGLIKQSDRFMRDFLEALETDLLPHQERIIDSKVRKFFERWETQLELSGSTAQVVKTLLTSMNNCKKFKFPWSVRETVIAREVVKHTLLNQKTEL
jgi:hypothetical protein